MVIYLTIYGSRPNIRSATRRGRPTSPAVHREQQIEDEENDEARIKIFSEGSSEGGVGASAVMYEEGQPGHMDRKALYVA